MRSPSTVNTHRGHDQPGRTTEPAPELAPDLDRLRTKTADPCMIIDWMDVTRGDIRLDVCRSYLLYGRVSDEVADLFLSEYCLQSGLEWDDVLRWLPVLAGVRLSEHVGEAEERRLAKTMVESSRF